MQSQIIKSALISALIMLGASSGAQAANCLGSAVYYAPDGKMKLFVEVGGIVYQTDLQQYAQTDIFELDLATFGEANQAQDPCTARFEPVAPFDDIVGDKVNVLSMDMPAIDAVGNRVTVTYKTTMRINTVAPAFTLKEDAGARRQIYPVLPAGN